MATPMMMSQCKGKGGVATVMQVKGLTLFISCLLPLRFWKLLEGKQFLYEFLNCDCYGE